MKVNSICVEADQCGCFSQICHLYQKKIYIHKKCATLNLVILPRPPVFLRTLSSFFPVAQIRLCKCIMVKNNTIYLDGRLKCMFTLLAITNLRGVVQLLLCGLLINVNHYSFHDHWYAVVPTVIQWMSELSY